MFCAQTRQWQQLLVAAIATSSASSSLKLQSVQAKCTLTNLPSNPHLQATATATTAVVVLHGRVFACICVLRVNMDETDLACVLSACICVYLRVFASTYVCR